MPVGIFYERKEDEATMGCWLQTTTGERWWGKPTSGHAGNLLSVAYSLQPKSLREKAFFKNLKVVGRNRQGHKFLCAVALS